MTEPKKDAVVIAFCHPETVRGRFMRSLLDLVLYDVGTSNRTVFGGGGLIQMESGPNLAATRNEIVRRFLTSSEAPWLLCLDADMNFEMDLLDQLMEYADPEKAPIVGGLCFSVGEEGVLPTLYDLAGTADAPEAVRYVEWPENAMMQVFATGAACLLIHRDVLRAIRDYRDPEKPGRFGFSAAWPWFQEIEFYGQRMSEDITFCLRAGVCGFPVFVNTAVKLGHLKQREVGHESYVKPPTQRPNLPLESGGGSLPVNPWASEYAPTRPAAPPRGPQPRIPADANVAMDPRTRERLIQLAVAARDGLDPAVVEANAEKCRAAGFEGLTWVWRDGEVIIHWGELELVHLDAETLERIKTEDELTIHMGQLPDVPDDISGL